MRGLTYFIKEKLYISVTNKCNSSPLITLRGPSFDWGKNFILLPESDEPSSELIFEEVHRAFNDGKINTGSMESESITFAGYGEPLLRLDVITKAAEMIKDSHHGANLRVKTNGLISTKESLKVANILKSSGIDSISISLLSDNPKQYTDLAKPFSGGLSEVCNFITVCAEAEMAVECFAIDRPDVNKKTIRELAYSLGASSFSLASYHP